MIKFTFEDHEYIPQHICYISGGATTSNSGSQQQSTSGFQALSPQIQQVFNTLAEQAGNYLQGGSQANKTSSMYTPLPQTAGETSALNTINQGFAPTQQQFTNSVNMQMNPYDQNVIGQINKQAYGANSQLASTLAQAGQFGSNRMTLGANDIANSQANTIGSILNPEYNTAVQNALTTIPGLSQQSAQAQLAGGQFQRSLAGQTAQAPVTGLQSIAQILGILPTQSGQSTGSSNSNSSGWNFGVLSSDEKLKENIVPVGKKNGLTLYRFNYKGGSKRFVGVMADEVEKCMPEAISYKDGYKAVNYPMIGIQMVSV